jgi:uncharacterized protein (TIGR04255 family)
MSFDLPPVEVPPLAQAPLRVALIQVKYHHAAGVEDPAQLSSFANGLAGFALIEQGTTRRRPVDSGESVPAEEQGVPETTWRFRSDDMRWTALLSPTTLGFETRSYEAGFQPVLEAYTTVVGAVAAAFSPTTRTRFGLRYVNELRDERVAEPGGLDALLNPDLVRPVGGALGWELEASLQELRFRESNGTYVLRHGLLDHERYLLDFDYFNVQETPFDVDATVALAAEYHRAIESMFAWALNGEYLTALGGRAS